MAGTWRGWLRMTMLAGLLSAGLAAAPARASDASTQTDSNAFLGGFLRESRVVYPTVLPGWEAQGEHRYDDQASGVSVRYLPTDQSRKWLDVYFYPAGVLSADELQARARAELDGIDESRNADGGETQIGPLQPVLWPGGGPQAYSASVRFEASGAVYQSAYLLLLDRLYFVKGRLSVETQAPTEVPAEAQEEALQRLMAELVSRTLITSWGRCWELDELPADAIGGTVVDDQGRSHPAGCEHAGPWNPEVGADMREIRFEYRPQPRVRESLKKEG